MIYISIVAGIAAYWICNYLHVTNYWQVIFGVVLIVIIFFTPHN